jgi:membrane glycosyltransferase
MARFGGLIRLTVSVLLETVFSILLAPLRMIFHAWYVILNLLGPKLIWNTQSRRSKKISFSKAFRAYWPGMAGAVIWSVIAFEVNRTLFWWVSAVVLPLIFAVPISVFFSNPALGLFFREHGLFLTPVETAPSKILRSYQKYFMHMK